MAQKTTSFALGGKLDSFIAEQTASGEYATATEVIRDALRRMMRRKERLAREHRLIDEGEASGLSPMSHDQVVARARAARAARGIR